MAIDPAKLQLEPSVVIHRQPDSVVVVRNGIAIATHIEEFRCQIAMSPKRLRIRVDRSPICFDSWKMLSSFAEQVPKRDPEKRLARHCFCQMVGNRHGRVGMT